MKRTFILAGLSVRDLLHRKVLYVFAAITLAIVLLESVSLILISRVAPTSSGADLAGMAQTMVITVHGVLWGFGGLGLIVLTMASISSEVTQDTGVMLISKGATRTELYAGKFLGVLILYAGYGVMASSLVFAVSSLIRGSVDFSVWRMELAGFLSTLVGISSAYAFAAAMSFMPAISLWFVAYILGSALPILARTTIPVLSQAAGALRYVYPGSGLFNLIQAQELMTPAKGLTGSLVGLSVLHAADYSAILLLLGAWAFSRRPLLSK